MTTTATLTNAQAGAAGHLPVAGAGPPAGAIEAHPADTRTRWPRPLANSDVSRAGYAGADSPRHK